MPLGAFSLWGLEQARLRNKQTEAARAEAGAALIELGVLQPRAKPTWQCAFDCGFCTTDQAELQKHQEQCATDEDGFSRSWDTGRWHCNYCEFEFNDADFTQDLSDKHRKACLYRRQDGSPFLCKWCEVPVCVKEGDLSHYRKSLRAVICQDCLAPYESTAEKSVQTDLPVHGTKHKRGKGAGQQEGQDAKETWSW